MIRPFSGLLALAALGCVSDYGIEKTRPQDPAPPDSGRLPGVDTASVWPVSCVPPPLADTVPTDESCVYEPVYGPLDAVVEWTLPRWSNYGEYSQVVMAPLVAQLTDDNGDGSIDRHDIPDIVLVADDEGVHTHKKGILRILPGDGSSPGSAVQRVDLDDAQIYPYRYSNLAIGDIDGDGQPEIVAVVLVVAGAFPGDDGGDDGGDDTAPPAPTAAREMTAAAATMAGTSPSPSSPERARAAPHPPPAMWPPSPWAAMWTGWPWTPRCPAGDTRPPWPIWTAMLRWRWWSATAC